MTSRDPLSIQVEPPDRFDDRRADEWTVVELMSLIADLGERYVESVGEEREELLRRESDVLRCLGWMCISWSPPVKLMGEWEQALADEKAATPYSTEWIEALSRQAEIQRACGANVMFRGRNYRNGAEPIP